MQLEKYDLSQEERNALHALMARLPTSQSRVEHIWSTLDSVWNQLGCNSKDPHSANVSAFYRHPVWLLNSLFIEEDPESRGHRMAIAKWIGSRGSDIRRVLDYGGGHGLLARMITNAHPETHVDVYEPYPSQYTRNSLQAHDRVHLLDRPGKIYDCVVSVDVLEHLADPIGALIDMTRRLPKNGYLILANCFYPVIKCHLPQTFHLRYSLPAFARLVGLQLIGECAGSHANIFQKIRRPILSRQTLRAIERISQALFPALEPVHNALKRWRGRPA